jgi:hypothetical protein
MSSHRLRLLLGLITLAGACLAILPGPAASQSASESPVMRVDYSFSGVGGKRPPNIVETRIVGKGQLFFTQSPREGKDARADVATGRIVVEYDILTPHPRTVRLTLRVTHAYFVQRASGSMLASLVVRVVKSEDGEGGTIGSCPVGSEGAVGVKASSEQVGYSFSSSRCQLKHGQTATRGANSRVHMTLSPKCLARTPAAGKPLCSKGTTKPKPKGCKLAGTWSQTTTDVGSTTWTIAADGKAKETGLGNASGTATLAGSVLTITWTTADAWAGVYRWTLTPTCSGTGTLTFTKGPRAGTVLASTVRGSAP